ncbi:hypothetical protein [Streptomyces sp. CA-132043]|uniref:hypothetical protein n=1 Tax=Streptomyces sp. CA-132043 TaxID=3240048 RepID=UPI003D8CE2E9
MIDDLVDEKVLRTLGDGEYAERLRLLEQEMAALPAADTTVAQLCSWCTDHGDWNVRRLSVEALAARFADDPAARSALCAATHDDIDWVAFTAIKVVGAHRITEARPRPDTDLRLAEQLQPPGSRT